MTGISADDRLARAVLSYVVDPGDRVLGALLRCCPAPVVVAALAAGRHPLTGLPGEPGASAEPGEPAAPADAVAPLDWPADPLEPVGPWDADELRAAGRMGKASELGRAERPGRVGRSGRAGWERGGIPGLDRALRRWEARIGQAPTADRLADWGQQGFRLICPGDPEWPTQLAALGDASPIALWLRGSADLRFACLRSVSVVGSRAATAYGSHVGTELAAALAERGWVIVSGGAFGIDSAAHRGALAADGVTAAVLASGLSYGYPKSHAQLFEAIAAQGVLVSELSPDRRPTRPGFLVRNRVIAALSRGTVVIEAALRSGALSTAARARDLCRPLMAVPGPVTSGMSAGCHELIREWGAVLVTGARDVLEHVSPIGEDLGGPRRGPVLPRDDLDPVTRAVLEAVPVRGGSGPASVAVSAGVDLDTVIRCLGSLAAGGFIERSDKGWRIRKER
jgi:DNA processing protein